MTKKMPDRSRYDELHDKYHRILTTKAGTRYERLAALVFKALEDANAVIYDMRLSGENPHVKHQIDVTVQSANTTRRVVIECKDFDISGEKIGLGIIRNFRSVIEDTQADEGIVITCTGFTEDAQKYARSKGIKLAILRLFETRDMEGRIARFIVGLVFQQPANPKATVYIKETDHPRYARELAAIGVVEGMRNTDPVFFVRNGERLQFNQFLTEQMNEAIQPAGPRAIEIKIPSGDWKVQVQQNQPISFDGIVVNFDVDEEQYKFEVTSTRIAEMVLSGFGTGDIVIFGDQIERRSIDPETGVVV